MARNGEREDAIIEDDLRQGLVHHRAGRAAEAKDCYRKVLAADPDNAEALHLLGVLALQAGNWDAAAARIERAIAVNDTVPAYHDHLAVVRRNQGRLNDAEVAHRRALALDPKFASAHNNLATTLRQAGRLADALQAAGRALEAAPRDARIAANAASLFMEARAYANAADAFGQAAAADPGSAALHERHGVALFRAGRPDAAEAAFREALRLVPDGLNAARWLVEALLMLERVDEAAELASTLVVRQPGDAGLGAMAGVAAMRAGDIDAAEAAYRGALGCDAKCLSALVGLATINASRGDKTSAIRRYRDALALDPDHVDAYGNLAMFGTEGLNVADAEHLAGLLKRKNLPEDQRATAAFALAHFLARVGEDAAAWDWFRTGNLLRRAHLRGAGHVFDAARHGGLLDARRRVFTAGFFAAREGFGHASERPVFVVGLPRSGTTLVEQILATHPAVHGAGELRELPMMALRRTPELAGGETPYPDCVGNLSAMQVHALAEDYLTRLAARADTGAARVIDKMPFNYLHLGLIHLMFPNARIVHCRRDPRDIGLSCFTTNFADAHAWSTDLGEIAAYINAYHELMAHWRAVLPSAVLIEVDYEALVADQEGESRRLVTSLGLDWDPACLDFHECDRAVTTASRNQVRQRIYASSVGRWRARQAELRALLERLVPAEVTP